VGKLKSLLAPYRVRLWVGPDEMESLCVARWEGILWWGRRSPSRPKTVLLRVLNRVKIGNGRLVATNGAHVPRRCVEQNGPFKFFVVVGRECSAHYETCRENRDQRGDPNNPLDPRFAHNATIYRKGLGLSVAQ